MEPSCENETSVSMSAFSRIRSPMKHVQNLFSGYGIVAPAEVLRHKYSTKSAGYWFIEMASAEQAWDSAVSLEGVLLAGHSLRLYVTPYASQTS